MLKESRINNQSREQRGSDCAWGGYYILYLNNYNGGLLNMLGSFTIQCSSQSNLR